MSFSSLGLSASILNALYINEYKKPYPVQTKVIPLVLDKKDVLVIAKTGSGKTASYVLPILSNLQNKPKPKNRHIDVLVLVPSRELSVQVEAVFSAFSSHLKEPIKSLAVYGGVSVNLQMIHLQNVRVLVATPGRLLDLIDSNAVHLSEVETLILDEADKMLNLGFKKQMHQILKLLPKNRQNLLFSATLNEDISEIKQIAFRNPIVINIEEEQNHFDNIKQTAYYLPEEKKGPFLRYLIKKEALQNILVFVSSSFKAELVSKKLIKNGINAVAIHGKQNQRTREKALEQFKASQIQVLVSTDLLSRGIDIEALPCVINYELPRSPKDYIHRIGRTGRAEATGKAISLVSEEEQHHFKIIQKKMGKWVDIIHYENIDFESI